MKTEPNYITVIGDALFRPIITLLEVLEKSKVVKPNEVQTSAKENGYSMAIILLSSVIFESAINRTCYLKNDAMKSGPIEYFKRLVSKPALALEIEEVIAVRDAIVHNHLWIAETYWDDEGLKFKTIPTLAEGYGNKRHNKVKEPATRRTRKLQLNLFPSRIWRRDAYITVKMVYKALLAIENIKREYFYISDTSFTFKKRYITLDKICAELIES